MEDASELAGEVALVTGGARNIGRAIALALAAGAPELFLYHHVSFAMMIAADASSLAALAKALPGRIDAAAQAVAIAERGLTRVLMLRATGLPAKPSELAVARMTVARTRRDAEDLQRIKSVLPALLEQAGVSPQAVRLAAVA